MFFYPTGMEINRGSSRQSYVSSACMADALAVREALLHASSLRYTMIWFRSDSQVLMREINQKRGPTELFEVLSDIVSLASSFIFCRFTFFFKACNGLADSIAKAQLCNKLFLFGLEALLISIHCCSKNIYFSRLNIDFYF